MRSLHSRLRSQSGPAGSLPTTWREFAAVALLLAALVAVFLREPILRYDHAYFSTADLLQHYALTTIRPGYVASNQLLSDPVVQFLPWLEFAKYELSQGRVPLWNPDNGCGVPLLANYQSAVFSPFSLFFYAFDVRFALIASGFAKLWLLGLFTFLFLRQIRLSTLPALLGASAFTFAGHNALLLMYPHSGVIVALPASLWIAERILARFESTPAPPRWRTSLGAHLALWLVLALAIYAGHPETLYFSVGTLSLWIAVRLLSIWRARGFDRASFRACFVVAGRFVVVGLLAACAGAPQLLPFLEYLDVSAKLAVREGDPHGPLDATLWARYFFPNFVGTSNLDNRFAGALPAPNYVAATLGYVGALVTVLAVVALPRAMREPRMWPFIAIAVLWPLWAHDVFGMAHAFDWIPSFEMAPIPVSQGPWLLALACLAAWQVQRLLDAPVEHRARRAASIATVGCAALALFLFAERAQVRDAIASACPSPTAIAASTEHVAFIVASFALGLAAVTALAMLARPRARRVAAGVVACVVFAQSGWVLSANNTVCEDEYFYPVSPNLVRLYEVVGRKRFITLGFQGLPPCTNLMYGLANASNYDALGVRWRSRLFTEMFWPESNWRLAQHASEKGLRLFGIEYLLYLPFARPNGASAQPASFDGDLSTFEALGKIGPFELYRYPRSLSRTWLVDRAFVATDDEDAFARLLEDDFDPRSEVVLGPQLPAHVEPRSAAIEQAAADDDQETRIRAKTKWLDSVPTQTRVSVNTDRQRYLVIAQTWFPGWKASIDGEPCPLLRANYGFTALDVPAGKHEVVLSYEPTSWWLGVRLALASTLLVVLAGAVSLWSRRQPSRIAMRRDFDVLAPA